MVPIELHEHILSYIDPNDKVYASMTCTLWATILKEQVIRKCKSTNKIMSHSAYDLYTSMKYFNDFHLIIKNRFGFYSQNRKYLV